MNRSKQQLAASFANEQTLTWQLNKSNSVRAGMSNFTHRLDAPMAAVEEISANTRYAFAAKDASLAEISRTLEPK
jgi:hypothetical protein